MIPVFPVYLFDVDGTLLDSQHDICGAIQSVFTARGRSDVTHEMLVPYIGCHFIDEFVELGFPLEHVEEMTAEYRTIYSGRGHAMTHVYPAIHDVLGRLGGRKATATTKGSAATREILRQFGLLEHFNHIQGTDGFPAKPEPDVLLRSAEALGAHPRDCLFIGDSTADMEAGRKAGMRVCAVTWGYGKAEELARWNPDFWAHAPHELLPDY